MLRNLPQSVVDSATESQRLDLDNTVPVEGYPGVYTGWGFDHGFGEVFLADPWFEPRRRHQCANDHEWEAEFRAWVQDEDRRSRSRFGVADSLDQILERAAWLTDDEQSYALVVTLVTRADSPDWRWHKHGPYIGDCTDRGEHLGQSGIEQVVTFTVHQYASAA